jgi:hypothetical protein
MSRPLVALLLLGWCLSPLPARDVRPQQPLRDHVLKIQGRSAYGVYVNKKKTGWEVEEFKLGTHEGKEVAVYTVHSYIALTVLGKKSVTEERSTTCYELTGEGKILYARVQSTEDKVETVRTAVRQGDGMLLTTRTPRRKAERKVPVPRDTLLLQRKLEAWLQGPPKKGDRFVNYSVMWEADDVDQKEVYTFQEKKSILWGGVPTDAYFVQSVSQDGTRTDAELRADGKPFVGRTGGLLEIRMEKEVVARALDGGAIDLVAAAAIPVDQDLGDPEKVDRLVLSVSGLEDFVLPQSHRQRVLPRKDGLYLELSRDFRVTKPVPLVEEDRRKFLRATPTIQADHEEVRRTARKVVGAEKDPVKAAGLLVKWVYKSLRKSYSANADNALTVLDNKAGDCTEHALLFVALARAVGLPAREVGGVAFVEGDKPLFGWHAWAEVYDGTQWVSVDPTWNQVYVDATHLKLSEGSQDFAWINVAGKLKMKVVEVKKRK